MPWLYPAGAVLPAQVDGDHPGLDRRRRTAAGAAGAGQPAAGQADAVSDDPVGAWRSQDQRAIRGLAALELRGRPACASAASCPPPPPAAISVHSVAPTAAERTQIAADGNRLARHTVQSDVIDDYLRDHDGVITLAQATAGWD